LSQAFDRFRQADQTSTRSYGGLGLGLSIVRQLVELHGGTVRAESEGEGRGATFIVSLPPTLARQNGRPHEIERRNALPSESSALDFPPQLRGARLLVVDDEADTREFLSEMLKQCGSEVITTSSGRGSYRSVETLGNPMCSSATSVCPTKTVTR
jgi:hypothetical protein